MIKRIINRLALFIPANRRKIFTRIYKKNAWNSKESVSGPGSSLVVTALLRERLPAMLQKWKIKTLLDAPCGDCNWISRADLKGIQYTGADIVAEIIESNRIKYPDKKFELLDIIHDPLPDADLILCRDCFIHLTNKDAELALEHFKKSGITYLLATTYPVTYNKKILTGHYRPVNLQIAPFYLPEPLELIPDFAEDGTEKYLGLWKLH